MRTITSIFAIMALPAFAGTYNPAISDPVVIPPAAPEDVNRCRMRLIPGTNVWQKADPYCSELPFTSPDRPDRDHKEEEVDCAVVAGPPENDAHPDPC